MTKVVAERMGFYGNLRRREGDEFELNEGDKPGSWMKAVDEMPAPEADAPDLLQGGEGGVVESDVTEADVSTAEEDYLTKQAIADDLNTRAAEAQAGLKQNTPKAEKAAIAALVAEAEAATEAAAAAKVVFDEEQFI